MVILAQRINVFLAFNIFQTLLHIQECEERKGVAFPSTQHAETCVVSLALKRRLSKQHLAPLT